MQLQNYIFKRTNRSNGKTTKEERNTMTQRIAQNMTIDRRTKAMIEVKNIKIGVVTLRYNNLELKLSHVEAERIGELLRKVTAVQRDRKMEGKDD